MALSLPHDWRTAFARRERPFRIRWTPLPPPGGPPGHAHSFGKSGWSWGSWCRSWDRSCPSSNRLRVGGRLLTTSRLVVEDRVVQNVAGVHEQAANDQRLPDDTHGERRAGGSKEQDAKDKSNMRDGCDANGRHRFRAPYRP